MVKSAENHFTLMRSYSRAWAGYFTLPGLLARMLFSLTMIARVVGMMMQYSSATIQEECLQVTSEGTLIQTPFSVGCLDVCDWIIIVLLSTVLSVIFSVVLLGVIFFFIRLYFKYIALADSDIADGDTSDGDISEC